VTEAINPDTQRWQGWSTTKTARDTQFSIFRFLTMAGIPANRVVLRSASLLTDAMESTGNRMPVMDAMGHGMMDMTRLYQHPGTKQIREAIEKRNQLVQ